MTLVRESQALPYTSGPAFFQTPTMRSSTWPFITVGRKGGCDATDATLVTTYNSRKIVNADIEDLCRRGHFGSQPQDHSRSVAKVAPNENS